MDLPALLAAVFSTNKGSLTWALTPASGLPFPLTRVSTIFNFNVYTSNAGAVVLNAVVDLDGSIPETPTDLPNTATSSPPIPVSEATPYYNHLHGSGSSPPHTH